MPLVRSICAPQHHHLQCLIGFADQARDGPDRAARLPRSTRQRGGRLSAQTAATRPPAAQPPARHTHMVRCRERAAAAAKLPAYLERRSPQHVHQKGPLRAGALLRVQLHLQLHSWQLAAPVQQLQARRHQRASSSSSSSSSSSDSSSSSKSPYSAPLRAGCCDDLRLGSGCLCLRQQRVRCWHPSLLAPNSLPQRVVHVILHATRASKASLCLEQLSLRQRTNRGWSRPCSIAVGHLSGCSACAKSCNEVLPRKAACPSAAPICKNRASACAFSCCWPAARTHRLLALPVVDCGALLGDEALKDGLQQQAQVVDVAQLLCQAFLAQPTSLEPHAQ